MIRLAAALTLIATQVGAQNHCGGYAPTALALIEMGAERVIVTDLPGGQKIEVWVDQAENSYFFRVNAEETFTCHLINGTNFRYTPRKPNL